MQNAHKLLSLIPLAIFVWYSGRFIEARVPWLVTLLIVFTGANVACVCLLRFRPEALASISKIPGLRNYLLFVCRVTGEQLPTGSAGKDSHEGLALRTHEEFEAAAEEAGQWVRGQSAALTTYLQHVRDTALLRQRLHSGNDDRPLASLVLAGAAGIGKRYLARVLGRLIFLDGAEQSWDLRKLGSNQVEALFGSKQARSALLISLIRQPFQTIILENIEFASVPLQDVLRTILQQGVVVDGTTGRLVSFRNTILVMTTTIGYQPLGKLASQPIVASAGGEADWHRQATEMLAEETGLSQALLTCVTDVLPLQQPDDWIKAEVVALAMCRECSKYGVRLEYVAPELLVQEVELIPEVDGFLMLEDRTKKMLQPALLEAARRNKSRLVLNARPVGLTSTARI